MKKASRFVLAALIIFFLSVALYCGYLLFDYWHEGQVVKQSDAEEALEYFDSNAEEAEPQPAPTIVDDEDEEEITVVENPVNFDELWEKSSNVVGWITVSGLEDIISYPLVWNEDDSYYLTHKWDDTYSVYGSIFIEANNSPDMSDTYTVIYGHNMRNGSMFGSLKKYRDSSFYEENGGLVTIYLPDSVRVYKIFSVETISADDADIYASGYYPNTDEYSALVQKMYSGAEYATGVSVSSSDTTLTLSTCNGNASQRFVVHAVLTNEYKTTPSYTRG